MAKVSQEIIDKATKVDIVEFCLEKGYAIESKGNGWYFGVEHDSLVINQKKNIFHWNSQNISGDSIKFVQTFFNKTFPEAIQMLTGDNYKQNEGIYLEAKEEFDYNIIHADNTEKVENYLINEREIDKIIVDALMKKGLIRQDSRGNCVFVWGATGRVVGADLQGTAYSKQFGKRGTFKQIMKNSEKNYGFNVSLGTPTALYFFESPVDALSYWSMNKNLNNCRLISMNGLKEQTIVKMISQTYLSRGTFPIDGIFLCLDNDKAGHKFFDKLKYVAFQTKDGQDIAFKNLIANDNQIPEEFIQMYQDAAKRNSTDWRYIAAIHKAETNLSRTNEITNHYEFGNFFGRQLEQGERVGEINILNAINKCARELSFVTKNGEINLEKVLGFGIDSKGNSGIKEKINYYYDLYSKNEFSVVNENEMLKDWNDVLKGQREKMTTNMDRQKQTSYNMMVENPKRQNISMELSR